jgi:hypothetical protein
MRMYTNHMGVQLIGVANKTAYLGRSWALLNDLRQVFRWFRLIRCAYESLRCLGPRSRDLAIFMLTTDDNQTRKPIALPLLRMRARGVMK